MSEPEALTLIRLTIRNLGRLELVNVKLEGESLVVICGDCEAGKSTLLRAIVAALASKAPLPGRLRSRDAKMPVADLLRRGENGGNITLEFTGGVTVSRIWTKKVGSNVTKSTLKVEGIDTTGGAKTALERLWSEIAIDLSSFDQMEPREQGDLARKALGINWTELDRQAAEHVEQRKVANAEVRRLEGHLAKLEPHDDAPDEEASTGKLLAELNRRRKHNAGLLPLEVDVKDAETMIRRYELRTAGHHKEIKRLKQQLEEAEARLKADEQLLAQERAQLNQAKAKVHSFEVGLATAAEAELAGFSDERQEAVRQLAGDDAGPVRLLEAIVEEELSRAGEVNASVRAKREHQRVKRELAAAKKVAAAHDDCIEEIKAEKARQLAAANFPVDGLSFADDGQMLLDEEPARQASGGRRLLAWAALALFLLKRKAAAAGLPFIGLLLVDEARWDARYLAKADKLAKEHGGQILLTKVGKEDATIVIEDGRVANADG